MLWLDLRLECASYITSWGLGIGARALSPQWKGLASFLSFEWLEQKEEWSQGLAGESQAVAWIQNLERQEKEVE